MGWVKVGSDLGLPMLHKMSIQVSSPPFPSPPFSYLLFWKFAGQIQMCSTNRKDLPRSTPFPLQWGWIADYGVDYEIRWVIANSGTRSYTPWVFFTVSVTKTAQLKDLFLCHELLGKIIIKPRLFLGCGPKQGLLVAENQKQQFFKGTVPRDFRLLSFQRF